MYLPAAVVRGTMYFSQNRVLWNMTILGLIYPFIRFTSHQPIEGSLTEHSIVERLQEGEYKRVAIVGVLVVVLGGPHLLRAHLPF